MRDARAWAVKASRQARRANAPADPLPRMRFESISAIAPTVRRGGYLPRGFRAAAVKGPPSKDQAQDQEEHHRRTLRQPREKCKARETVPSHKRFASHEAPAQPEPKVNPQQQQQNPSHLITLSR